MSTRILLADDHAEMREALLELIEAHADLEVVGEAENGRAAVRLALELLPDVVVMDVTMPVMNGIEATSRLAAEAPGVRVLGLSMHADSMLVRGMLRAGASGYVPKDLADRELAGAVRAVMAGETYLSPGVAGAVAGFRSLRDPPVRALLRGAGLRPPGRREAAGTERPSAGRERKRERA